MRSIEKMKASGFCQHGNFPSSCRTCAAETAELHGLLLNVDEERAEMKKYAAQNFFEIPLQSKDRQIVLCGTRHTNSQELAEPMIKQYEKINPDLVIYEGNALRDVFQGMSDDEIKALDPKEVIQKEEQVYMAWRAFKDGKKIETWDLPFKKQLEMALAKRGPEAVAGWLAAVAL